MSDAMTVRNGATMPAKARDGAAVIERVVIEGDLSRLTPAERVEYYRRVCESLGLNPYTKPFDYITLNGKLTLYARKDATEQLRRRDNISVEIVARELLNDIGVYAVTARARTPDGRTDEAIGAVSVAGLKGEALANAIMKAETKAKRRVTLSICGLGWLDETEVADVPDARTATVDHETGEILDTTHQNVPASENVNRARPAARRAPVEAPRPRGVRPSIDWSGFWKAAKGELGLSEDEVHREAAAFFGKDDLKSLTQVVKEQADLDRFLAHLRSGSSGQAAEAFEV